jgi:hypothetical protein
MTRRMIRDDSGAKQSGPSALPGGMANGTRRPIASKDAEIAQDGPVDHLHLAASASIGPRLQQFKTPARPRARTKSTLSATCRAPERVASEPPSMPSAPPPPRYAGITVVSRLSPAKPTAVYDTFWRFASERQAVFFQRFAGAPAPWTSDPILRQYKFTNAYRASDRVSQYLIRHVIYKGDQTPREVFFRVLLFKIFNRIQTWERLVAAVGEVRHSTYHFEQYEVVLSKAIEGGEPIYSGAYIMPSGGRTSGEFRKHRMHLRLLERMVAEALPERIAEARRMADAFELLRAYPTIGDFLAYQYVIDLNYSGLSDFRETEFVVPGPGAKDGIRKCFDSLGGLSEADMIRFVTDRQEEEFRRLGLAFQSLWGRPLQYVDCQNLFCEVDKYSRVFHPGVVGVSRRTRIKQRFRPTAAPINYWYAPKWGINDAISLSRRHLDAQEGSDTPYAEELHSSEQATTAVEARACT